MHVRSQNGKLYRINPPTFLFYQKNKKYPSQGHSRKLEHGLCYPSQGHSRKLEHGTNVARTGSRATKHSPHGDPEPRTLFLPPTTGRDGRRDLVSRNSGRQIGHEHINLYAITGLLKNNLMGGYGGGGDLPPFSCCCIITSIGT